MSVCDVPSGSARPYCKLAVVIDVMYWDIGAAGARGPLHKGCVSEAWLANSAPTFLEAYRGRMKVLVAEVKGLMGDLGSVGGGDSSICLALRTQVPSAMGCEMPSDLGVKMNAILLDVGRESGVPVFDFVAVAVGSGRKRSNRPSTHLATLVS